MEGIGVYYLAYVHNIFFPYSGAVGNPCEFSQYISFYPIPLLMGIYYLYKNKKESKKFDTFLLLTVIFSILLSIWCIFPLPSIISKITLMTMSTTARAQLVLGYASVFMLVYILSKYEINKNILKIDRKKILVLLLSISSFIIVLILSNKMILTAYENGTSILKNLLSTIIFLPLFYLLIYNNKKTNLFFVIGTIFVIIVSSILIHPLSKGLSIVYEKPFAKEIQKLVDEDSDLGTFSGSK